ncbi:Netrin-4 Beta-netrin Precursor [Channa argus]|uniref:Netrin-4 Beta-netrin n=1 Tax=Channa argus TaxID=215402 RepID=A0A6G1PH21_CHAAH|nr:Netrin-4 Beta-netrin Precursor [Channa argus]
MAVALSWLVLVVTRSGAVSRCEENACSPPIGNLATGRTLHTLSGCCGNSSHHHSPCPYSPVVPYLCPRGTHPPAHMTDDPFLHPDTWWASGAGTTIQKEQDEIRLDLETKFCLSHVILLFRSPRPAAMAIERSADFGTTWEPLKLFAHNCSTEFGLPDDLTKPGSLCTSRYTGATPCSGGEVILRTLEPSTAGTLDPYSPEILARLILTNLRIRLLKAQICRASPIPPAEGIQPSDSIPTSTFTVENSGLAPYAIYTLLVRGTCLCHGHAEYCVPHNSSQEKRKYSNMQGITVRSVLHSTMIVPGDLAMAEAGCRIHVRRAWLSSGGTSGGVCDDCKHNTVGRKCQRCRYGYHRHPSLPLNSPHACTRCWCDPQGSLSPHSGDDGPWCHPRSGQCRCKSGVGGTSCSHCLSAYWGFGEEGCKPCACPHNCDPTTGQCLNSYGNNQVFNVPIGGKVPGLDHIFPVKEKLQWSKELSVSALHYTMIKASVLSAHDKGSHAEVEVKVRKVLRSGLVALYLGTVSIYPLSWTSRGCTCPILNPGVEYLLAGPEEPGTGRLLVTLQSIVVPWTARLGLLISDGLRNGCP